MKDKDIRKTIDEMLTFVTENKPPERVVLTNGEQAILSQLRENADIKKAIQVGRLDRYLIRSVMADILPLPISVVERVTGKFTKLLQSGDLKADMSISTQLTEAMAQAGNVASNAVVDELGMYGIGDGANIQSPGGDADKGSTQDTDRGVPAEGMKAAGPKKEAAEPPPAGTPPEDKDDDKEQDKDVPPPAGTPAPTKDEIDKKAESIIQGWKARLEASVSEDEDKDDDDEDDKDDEGKGDVPPQFMSKKEAVEECAVVEEAIATAEGLLSSFTESGDTDKVTEIKADIAAMEDYRTALKAAIREDDRDLPNQTQDADPGADYDKLSLVPGVDDYSRGPAAIEAKDKDDEDDKDEIDEGPELQPVIPGDGSQGNPIVVPQQDTKNALESEVEEGSELQPVIPGDGSQGAAPVAPVQPTYIDKGRGQNENRKATSKSKK